MLGEPSHVSRLGSTKQLLIAESELNRALLSQEWQTMEHEVCDLVHRAKTIAAWTSSVALLLAGFTALRRGQPAASAKRSSWFQKMLSGARLASTIWFAFRPRGAKAEHE